MVSAASKKYHRNFIIFSNEDSGYEEGKKPSGHLMLEVRDRKAKLAVVIQNLRSGKGRFGYALYLMRTGDGAVEYVRAGEIRHSGNRAELDMTFDQGYIDGTVYSVDDFDTFAVLVESENRPGASAACPLAAYRNGRTDWRGGLRKAMQNKLAADKIHMSGLQPEKAEVQPDDNTAPAPAETGGLQSEPEKQYPTLFQNNQIYDPAQDTTAGYGQMINMQTDYAIQYENNYQPEQITEHQPQFELSEQYEPEYGVWPKPEAEPAEGIESQPEEFADVGGEAEMNAQQPEFVGADGGAEANAQLMENTEAGGEVEMSNPEAIGNDADVAVIQPETANNEEQSYQDGSAVKPLIKNEDSDIKSAVQTFDTSTEKHKQQVQQPPGKEYNYPGSTSSINTECVYLNGNICGAVINNGNADSPCGTCHIYRRAAPGPSKIQEEGDLNGLEEELDKSFDICDPFHSRRSDYIWWRVTNPVNLNNMFYQNNIRSPLMFNPAVMMAHYKYKHLIIGVFTHKTGQRYIICGVPGMYMVDSKPFGEMSKWVQAEGNRQRYGAFGYWLIYINPKDGKIINF